MFVRQILMDLSNTFASTFIALAKGIWTSNRCTGSIAHILSVLSERAGRKGRQYVGPGGDLDLWASPLPQTISDHLRGMLAGFWVLGSFLAEHL
jgi:hypothetical protein